MSQLKNMSILLVIAFAAAILQNTEATDHIVGGSTGWTASLPNTSFYSDWASNIKFKENDVLVFNFVAGGHTVAQLSKANFDNCNVNQNTGVITTSPARITLNKTGDFYFTCTVQGHCGSGQKLSVKVSASSPPPAQGPSPTPPSPTPPSSGTTPTPPSPTPPVSGDTPSPSSSSQPGATPPSPGSATTLFATFSILMVVVLNLLF